jgi:hypothetical protein
MSPRSIRRSIERKARKQAQKVARLDLLEPQAADVRPDQNEDDLTAAPDNREQSARDASQQVAGLLVATPAPSHRTVPALSGSENTSARRLAANRANAQLSTGPKSDHGKAKASRNALKTGLTGHTVLLPEDDAAAYEDHVRRFFGEYGPSGDRERELVQSLADTQWRLSRIPGLEMGIYALARIQFADLFPDHDPEVRAALIEVHAFVVFQKQLNNLSVQEARLRRHFEKDLAELKSLQADCRRQRPKPASAPLQTHPSVPDRPFNGFEFSDSPLQPETGRQKTPQAAHTANGFLAGTASSSV